MAGRTFLGSRLLGSILMMGMLTYANGFTLHTLEPVSGLSGTTVEVRGDFDPAEDYEVKLGEQVLSLTGKSEDVLTFVVPNDAVTDNVSVNGEVLLTPFAVLREITGTFDAPAGVAMSGYSAGTLEDIREVGADGRFTALVEKGISSSVMVFRGENEPAFVAFVASAEMDVVVGAASSAEALVLGSPFINKQSESWLEDLRPRLLDLPSFDRLVELIESGGRSSFLSDARVDLALLDSVSEILATEPEVAAQHGPPFKSGEFVRTTDAALRDLNPDPTNIRNLPFRHEDSLESFVGDDPAYIDLLAFGVERARDTRLDWTLTVRELDPFQFPNGFADLAALEGNDPETAPIPLDSGLADAGWIRAKLFSERFDLLKRATDGARDLLFGGLEKEAMLDSTSIISIPNEPDAIYMSTATSGNFWYGTDWLFPGANNQEASIDMSGASNQWMASAAANIVIAAADTAGIFLKVKDLPGLNGDYLKTASISVVKTLSAYRSRSDALTQAAIYELLKNLAADMTREAAAQQAKRIPEKATKFLAMAGAGAKFMFKSVDLFGKLSSAGQALERTGTLFSPGTLAMERSILVVGDPFAPNITSVSPQNGRVGDEVIITGANLANPDGTLPLVTFCKFPESIPRGETPQPDPGTAPLPAEVLEAKSNRLKVRVPTGFSSHFGNQGVFLCVERSTEVEGHSFALGEKGKFTLIPPPTITRLDPPPESVGGAVTIIGESFLGRHPKVTVDDVAVETSPVDATHLLVILPPLQPGVDHTMSVSYGMDESAPFVFQVARPEHVDAEFGSGGGIRVSSLTMTNIADAEISVKEAFLLANGGLGRGLTDEERTKAPQWESAGANRRDVITFDFSVRGETLVLNEPLPAIDTSDRISFRGLIIDGSGAPPGSDGLVLDGSSNVEISEVVLTGWPGDGLRITNGSSGNVFREIEIRDVGGVGVYIENESNFNSFNLLSVNGAGANGITTSGLCHHNTFTDVSLENLGGHGVSLSDRVDRHRFENTGIGQVGGHGIFLEGEAVSNIFGRVLTIEGVGGTGVKLSGSGVRNNMIRAQNVQNVLLSQITDCGEQGIHVDAQASFNSVASNRVSKCLGGGIVIEGEGTKGNTLGRLPLSHPKANLQDVILVYTEVTDSGEFDDEGEPEGTVPGVRLGNGAESNLVVGVSVSGSAGDGIRLEGANCRFNSIASFRTGVADDLDLDSPVLVERVRSNPNFGSSVRVLDGAHHTEISSIVRVFIGNFAGGNFSFKWRNRIANDKQHGIVIESGAHSNVVLDTDIGGTDRDDGEGAMGQSGIVIQTGAYGNVIGGNDRNERVFINACPEIGLVIDGEDTHSNVLSNIDLGTIAHRGVDTSFGDLRPNALGVVLRNGTHGNLVGVPGPLKNAIARPAFFPPPNATMRFQGVSGATVTLDSCGGRVGANGAIDSPNIVQACDITTPGTGIRITGGAKGNLIGSKDGRNGNRINLLDANAKAGIHIDANVIPATERDSARNRFYSNSISAFTDLELGVDLFAEPARGVGLLISNGSSGNVFGEHLKTTNFVKGVLIEGANGNQVKNTTVSPYGNNQGHRAGFVVRDCSNNEIGGRRRGEGNRINNGFFGAPHAGNMKSAGIALVRGGMHLVRGNEVSVQSGHGILVENSSSNVIGGSRGYANQLHSNARSGLMIGGAASVNNGVHGNWIGTDVTGIDLGNGEHGVVIDGGASGNRIGGNFVNVGGIPVQLIGYSGNTIAFNGSDGVIVSDPGSVNNSILYNSIYGNDGRGIALSAEGNDGLQVASSGSVGVGQATGTITNLDEIPPGSIIQLFADDDLQGELYLGQAELLQGGSWLAQNLPPFPFSKVTFTVTILNGGGFGNTSEFYTLQQSVQPSFRVERQGGSSPEARTVAFENGILSVLGLTLIAEAVPFQLDEITLKAGGSLDELAQVDAVRLYRDTDRDGKVSDRDEAISEPVTFSAVDGEITFALGQLVVRPGEETDMVVAYHSDKSIEMGATITLELTEATAHFLYLPGEAVATNAFPVESDMLTIGTPLVGMSLASWQATFFAGENDPLVIGPEADPDGDGLSNLLEFFFGTDPTDRKSRSEPTALSGEGERGLVFAQAADIEGVTVEVEASEDMRSWSVAEGSMTNASGFSTFRVMAGNGPLYLRLRVSLLP